MSDLEALFLSIGLKAQNAAETVRNPKLSSELVEIIKEARVENGCEANLGSLLYTIATKLPGSQKRHRSTLVKYVAEAKILTADQLLAALKYVQSIGDGDVVTADFESACGVGVVITKDTIQNEVKQVIEKNRAKLLEQRYKAVGVLIKELKFGNLKWADGKAVNQEVDDQVAVILGPKTAEDTKKGKSNQASQSATKAEVVLVHDVPKPTGDFEEIKLKDLASKEGKLVQFSGWLHHVRPQKTAIFMEVRDGTGFVQVVVSGKLTQTKLATELYRESSVIVLGKVVKPPAGNKAKWTGLEVQSEWFDVIGKSDKDIEGLVNESSEVDRLFDQRHIVHRSEKPALYLKLRSMVVNEMRQHFFARGYTEVTPPTICQTPCEGGSELFHFDFFGEDATLTQSSQLYLESVLPAVGDCFCIASSYRAETSRTRRHLAEYTHLEGEMPFITFDDLLNALEDLICDTVDRCLASFGDLLKTVNPNLKPLKRPFKRMKYVDAIDYCNEHDIKMVGENGEKIDFKFGDDIKEREERQMVEMIGEPVFLTHFPVELKAFYMPKNAEDPRVTDSVDLLVPGVGEVIGGSMRIHDYDELMAAYKREKIDPTPFYWFTDQRKYGSVPHGGYGLGVERFLCWLFADDHIRNVTLYPRMTGRCKP